MQLTWGPRRRSAEVLALAGGPDLISALPDDLLLLVLARLPCVSAAARTGVLSRRWRSLWARLRQIVFRDVPFPSLEPVLARFPLPPPAVSLIHIRVPKQRRRVPKEHRDIRVPKEHRANGASVNSLLRAAARLEPEECVFEFELLGLKSDGSLVVDLPGFHRATSIVLNLSSVIRSVPAHVEFTALETLSLSYCTADIDGLLSCCPRLRALRLNRVMFDKPDLQVNSASLQEFILDTPEGHRGWIHRISIVAPVLKQLTMSFFAPRGSISILAPMVKKVRWHCCFSRVSVDFNLWGIQQVTLQTAEGQGHLPSLHIHASARFYISLDEEDIITPEIEKHMVAEFSVLELHLTTNGHVFGAFAFHLLGMNRICSAMQRLKVVLQRSAVKERCSPHCPCESTGWRSQTISLAALEEVEIDGFGGDDHEIDFLKLIFRCAPLLKRVIVKLSDGASSNDNGCTKIYNIFKAHSSVELYVYLSSDYESELISICLL